MYITYYTTNNIQLSAVDAIRRLYDPNYTAPQLDQYSDRYIPTRTITADNPYIEVNRTLAIIKQAEVVAAKCNLFLESIDHDTSTQYEHFAIPKHSGGLRHISAPNEAIKEVQYDIITFFRKFTKNLEHQAAYGYVKGRCTKDALVTHQRNQARWFLKLDLKNFFPSCTEEFVLAQLKQLFPIHVVPMECLVPMVRVCLLNGGLPQGAPSSPYLTNLIMIPIDHELTSRLYQYNKSKYIYTRYADDLLITNPYTFKYTEIVNIINEVLGKHQAPFKLNQAKTRYGSASGRNWNLGLMYNSDGKITVGHKRKRRVKSMLHNFFRDYHTGNPWSKQDTQILLGELAYVNSVEGDSLNLAKLEQQYSTTMKHIAKVILNDRVLDPQ